MSSLMQFKGRIEAGKVGLRCFIVDCTGNYTEFYKGTNLPVLYEFFRKPCGMFGCWVVFRYLGEEHPADLSTPLNLTKLPVGAKRIDDEEGIKYWHS